jgi:hypothetical protein
VSYAVIASDQDDPVSPDTDLADALAVAPRVANERGCEVKVIRNDSGDEYAKFVPDSSPEAPAQEPTNADRAAADGGARADAVKDQQDGDSSHPRNEGREARPLAEQADPNEMTVAELDQAFGDQDGYPKSETKDAKVKFALKASK